MNLRSVAANGAWLASSIPSALAFHSGFHGVADMQESILLRILRRNSATEFGRRHDFASIRSIAEYQRRLPVRTFDQYPELAGDPRLLTASPITHHEPTSGSSGTVKRIPYTLDLRAEMERAIAPWIVTLCGEHPAAFAGEAYWSISPSASEETRPDEEVLGPIRARLVRAVQAVPSEVGRIVDVDAFRRATLLHLLQRPDLSLISVWHPSFLLLLLSALRQVAAEVPDPRVTAALREDDDAALHQRLWPHLRVISCWSDANAARDAAMVARLFPHAHLQPKGLLSTEGFVTIPLAEAEAPALAYRSHFYELRDLQSERVVMAAEGEVGQRYQVVLTTGAGLYRYDTEDVVEVVGFRETCPLLRFIGRARHVSDHFGEKLNEIFVRERLETLLGEHDVSPVFVMLACEERAYALFLESDAGADLLATLGAALDDLLRQNVHYDYCRRLGQLGPLRVFRVSGGSATYLMHAGLRLGDVKVPALDSRGGWGGRFVGGWV